MKATSEQVFCTSYILILEVAMSRYSLSFKKLKLVLALIEVN